MSSSPACRIAIGTRVRTQLSTLKMNSSGGPRVVGWHELTKGQGEAARGGQASAAQRTHHALWSCVRGDRFCGVTTSSMGRETPEPLAMRQQAAIVCELRKPLVQDKYSVKAKAQQLMYGFMGCSPSFPCLTVVGRERGAVPQTNSTRNAESLGLSPKLTADRIHGGQLPGIAWRLD